MEQSTVELRVPSTIYESAEEIARNSDRSAEKVILDALSLIFAQSPESHLEPEDLKEFADDQLLAVFHQRLAWPQEARLRELMRLGQMGQVTDEEIAEMEVLVDVVDQQILLRSEALLLLKQRGHDIAMLLKPGA